MRVLAGLSPKRRLLLGGAAATLLLVLIIVIALLVRSQTQAADEQPIAFSHEAHAATGVQCQYCHSGVNKSAVAGIPSVELCMGCHQYVGTDIEAVQDLRGYWDRQEPIHWQRVNEQPAYVYFSHQPHIAAGVSCGSCHGDVASMTVAEPVVEMNMGFCLDCHAEQENKDELWDCVVCHR